MFNKRPLNVLLTRVHENNIEIINALDNRSFNFYEEPLITYHNNEDLLNSISKTIHKKPVLISSIHAAKLASYYLKNSDIDAFVVGDHSSTILKSSGINVQKTTSTISELLDYICNIADLIYLRGSHISMKVPFEIKEYVIYESKYKSRFSSKAIELLQNNQIDIVTLFSQKCAHAFVECLKYHNLQDQGLYFYCLSKNIASIIHGYGLNALFSPHPDLESFKRLFLNISDDK